MSFCCPTFVLLVTATGGFGGFGGFRLYGTFPIGLFLGCSWVIPALFLGLLYPLQGGWQ